MSFLWMSDKKRAVWKTIDLITHQSPCQMLVIRAIVINTEIIKKCYSQSCICTYIYIHTHKYRKTVDLISIDYIITTVTKTIIICFHQFGFPVHEHDVHFCERTHKFVLTLVIISIGDYKMMQKQFYASKCKIILEKRLSMKIFYFFLLTLW